jgi:hypothetical protein
MTPAALASAAALALGPVQPGGHVGAMIVDRGRLEDAQQEFFAYCDPFVSTAGVRHRTCRVPRAKLLFIGYGSFEKTLRRLNHEWRREKWYCWLDGRRIGLLPFGAHDRRLEGLRQAGGADVILREWQVMLIGVTPGRHTLRYRSRTRDGVVTDTTWTFTVD